ncbi:MAG: tyrosinase family protein, partial [Candidatus Methylumidiphilus sp.]
QWHGTIGGAMSSTLTAIADPIFYFGVHWHIDRIFDEYKTIQHQLNIHALDRDRLLDLQVLGTEIPEIPSEFTDEQRVLIEKQREQSIALHSWIFIE